jgi:formylglycine-generating enzyme required for sulfatase activity
MDSPLWALVMGFEHERIHIETSSVLINEMPQSSVRFPSGFAPYHPIIKKTKEEANQGVIRNPELNKDYPLNEFIAVPAQNVTVGKPRDFPSFGWDNEYGQRSYSISAFKATKFKVTNGEYLEFVRDGGYANKDYWSEVF